MTDQLATEKCTFIKRNENKIKQVKKNQSGAIDSATARPFANQWSLAATIIELAAINMYLRIQRNASSRDKVAVLLA